MSKYIQIEFLNISSEQSEILVAQLSSIGFEGFEEEEFKWAPPREARIKHPNIKDDESIDRALKRLKRKFISTGTVKELRRRKNSK